MTVTTAVASEKPKVVRAGRRFTSGDIACAEGALQIIDGKARLLSDK